jgi:hypothetical protein
MKRIIKTQKKADRIEKDFNQSTVEERLKIIANLIIDRLMEQGNGKFNKTG